MLSLPVAVRIFVFTGVTDMRRSFDGLAAMVESEIGQNPESGHLFLFFNRRHDRVKILFWQGDGLVLWYKRLEGSTFPSLRATSDKAGETPALEIRAGELAMLLDGVDPRTVIGFVSGCADVDSIVASVAMASDGRSSFRSRCCQA